MSSPQTKVQAALKRRVRAFYAHLNARAFDKCFRFLDPRIFAQPGSVTLVQYESSLAAFMAHVGEVLVKEVAITGLHVGQPNKLYEGRDFAIGKTAWEAADGSAHQFAERWVCDNGVWYTRAAGFVLPDGVSTSAPVRRPEKATPSPKKYVTKDGMFVPKVKPLKTKKVARRSTRPLSTKNGNRG